MRRTFLLAATAAFIVSAAAAAAQGFTARDLNALARISEPRISPDGSSRSTATCHTLLGNVFAGPRPLDATIP